MDEAAVHAVDVLADTPIFVVLVVIAVLLTVCLIKIIPFWKETKTTKLNNDKELEQKRIDIEANYREKQLEIERDREKRKMEETKQRIERDKENAIIMTRAVAAQERSNVVMSESTAQLSILNTKLDVSQQGSTALKETVGGIAVEVHDIHQAVVPNGRGGNPI